MADMFEVINAELLDTLRDTERFLLSKARRDPKEREIVRRIGDAIYNANRALAELGAKSGAAEQEGA